MRPSIILNTSNGTTIVASPAPVFKKVTLLSDGTLTPTAVFKVLT